MTLPIAILAGGLATRLRPITEQIPKALVPVQGEPFVNHQLRLLAGNGFKNVFFLIGYKGEEIVQVVGDGSQFGLNVNYIADGPLLLGTGGAVARAVPYLGEEFAVIYGDSWLDFDYAGAIQKFHSENRAALMTVFKNGGRWDGSNVHFDGAEILAYSKKNISPDMAYIDYGFSVFTKSVFSDIPLDRRTDLADICESLVEVGQLAGYEVTNRFYEVGSFQGLFDFEAFLAGERK